MMMRMMKIMTMNYFCGKVDQRKAFNTKSNPDCHTFSSLQTPDTPQAGFELAQSLRSGFLE